MFCGHIDLGWIWLSERKPGLVSFVTVAFIAYAAAEYQTRGYIVRGAVAEQSITVRVLAFNPELKTGYL
jgi:hypothetical protein